MFRRIWKWLIANVRPLALGAATGAAGATALGADPLVGALQGAVAVLLGL